MSGLFSASVEDVVGQLVFQAFVHRARGGDPDGARRLAERTLERLLAKGLPFERGPGGETLLDPYAASNALKSRKGEPEDEAWASWVETARRNATSLPSAPHLYRLRLEREWRLPPSPPGRPVVLRLPLPLRGALRGTPTLRLIEPEGALIERRDEPGRVEIRLDPGKVRGAVIAEMTVEFVSGDVSLVTGPGLEEPAAAIEQELFLRPQEGLIANSEAVTAFARDLPGGVDAATELVGAAFARLIGVLRLGDVHREHLDPGDRIGGLLRDQWVDCALGATLLVAICRARGIPARIVSGFLLHPAVPAPHYWAEVRVAPGRWVPFDIATWDYCAGDPDDEVWGSFFRGRIDARFVSEIAPREFTGWGSARPPERWFRLQGLDGDGVVHTLRALPSGELFQRDRLFLNVVGPA